MVVFTGTNTVGEVLNNSIDECGYRLFNDMSLSIYRNTTSYKFPRLESQVETLNMFYKTEQPFRLSVKEDRYLEVCVMFHNTRLVSHTHNITGIPTEYIDMRINMIDKYINFELLKYALFAKDLEYKLSDGRNAIQESLQTIIGRELNVGSENIIFNAIIEDKQLTESAIYGF